MDPSGAVAPGPPDGHTYDTEFQRQRPAMSEHHIYPPADDFASNAHVDAAKYDEMYAASINDPEGF